MKIIQIDNFGRDSVSDVLIGENVHEGLANELVERLNDEYSGDNSNIYFVVKPDDYKLYTFKP